MRQTEQPQMTRWGPEAELALRAVARAVGVLSRADRRGDRRVLGTKESPRDVVTQYDRDAEAVLVDTLRTSTLPILAEESAVEGVAFDPPTGPYWIVDALDGTANFIAEVPFYAVSIGLWMGDRAILGVVSSPILGELYFGDGQTAHMNGHQIDGGRQGALASSLLCASFSSTFADTALRAREFLAFGELNDASRGCLRLGSAGLSICYVAAGRIGAAYGLRTKLWDVAGSLAIAAAAGCKVLFTRPPGSLRVDYVVGTPVLVDAIASVLTHHAVVAAPLDPMCPQRTSHERH